MHQRNFVDFLLAPVLLTLRPLVPLVLLAPMPGELPPAAAGAISSWTLAQNASDLRANSSTVGFLRVRGWEKDAPGMGFALSGDAGLGEPRLPGGDGSHAEAKKPKDDPATGFNACWLAMETSLASNDSDQPFEERITSVKPDSLAR